MTNIFPYIDPISMGTWWVDPHILLLILYWELSHVLLYVKQIVDLFLSFIESFSQLDR